MTQIKYFGTDGIRGRAGEFLTAELAQQAAFHFAGMLGESGRYHRSGRPVFVIARDSRLSSPMLAAAAISGLTAGGADVVDLGIVPTPRVPFAILERKAAGGAMITASHNPVKDNGIKFFGPDGRKLPAGTEKRIERKLKRHSRMDTGDNIHFGAVSRQNNHEAYRRFLKRNLRRPKNKGMKIALDCAWGATAEEAPAIFKEYGFKIVSTCDSFDGSRVNVRCGATDLSKVGSLVRKSCAAMGLAFDGDGDRVLAVDAAGRKVSGDKIIALFATRLARYRSQGGVVMTKMSNMAIEQALKEAGIRMHRTEVGDINVARKMMQSGLSLGGEQSGHIIMADLLPSGDGILAGLQLSLLVNSNGRDLAALVERFSEYPQRLTNLKIRDKSAWQNDGTFRARLSEIHAHYPDVRFYLRPSGTENLVRVLTESQARKRCDAANSEVCRAFTEWSGGNA